MKLLPRNTILAGDAVTVLPDLLPQSIDCVITSPPYFRMRDYGVSGQLGREATVDQWVANIRRVFRGVARVLKPHGSVWLNVGDTYSKHPRAGAPPKSLLAGPDRLLLALMADGWLVRNKVVWAKQNPLPSPATDRLSPTYEVIYFLTRQRDYYFDLDAIRIEHRSANRTGRRQQPARLTDGLGGNSGLGKLKLARRVGHRLGKNPGDVWSLPTANYPGAHFATFPAALVQRPLLATCPERICVQCDTAWRRPVRMLSVHASDGTTRTVRRLGGLRRCGCLAPARPGIVLDPFFGVGTVGVVAERHGRDWLGIELNPAYRRLARQRLRDTRTREAA